MAYGVGWGEGKLVGGALPEGPFVADFASDRIDDMKAEKVLVSFVGDDGEAGPVGDSFGDIRASVTSAGYLIDVFPGPGHGFSKRVETLAQGKGFHYFYFLSGIKMDLILK